MIYLVFVSVVSAIAGYYFGKIMQMSKDHKELEKERSKYDNLFSKVTKRAKTETYDPTEDYLHV